jgi:nitrous oxidase accessory protein NosD
MTKARIGIASMVAAICLVPALAHAQATRTWVSGVGDDANPCSRTAPCKTFAGAISKTAELGEIDTLDPGGFGGVTITKSITIDGTSGIAGVLVSGTNGIIINAGATDMVILRNLDINGVGTGLAGIRIIQAGDVRVEHCKIYGFARGIEDSRTAGHTFVSDTVISENGQTGIILSSGSWSASLALNLDRVQLHHNTNSGIAVLYAARVVINNSSATSNGAHGFYADLSAVVDINDSVASGNGGSGVVSIGGATVRLSNNTITGNTNGLTSSAGSNLLSFGNNRISGNTTNGAPTGMIGLQ